MLQPEDHPPGCHDLNHAHHGGCQTSTFATTNDLAARSDEKRPHMYAAIQAIKVYSPATCATARPALTAILFPAKTIKKKCAAMELHQTTAFQDLAEKQTQTPSHLKV